MLLNNKLFMTSSAIRNNIYKALENIDDSKFLKAVFEIVSEKAESSHFFELNDKQKALLDEREQEYIQGKGKNFNWQEAKKMIRGKKDVS